MSGKICVRYVTVIHPHVEVGMRRPVRIGVQPLQAGSSRNSTDEANDLGIVKVVSTEGEDFCDPGVALSSLHQWYEKSTDKGRQAYKLSASNSASTSKDAARFIIYNHAPDSSMPS